MKNNCIFTICATNYIGLAKALEQSVLEYTHNVEFYIVVADEPSMQIKNKFSSNVLISKEILSIKQEKWHEMAFKYNLTEFCTSIKPFSFNYFFNKGYEKVVYMDPDILTFSSMDIIFDYLVNYSAVVTPHILTPNIYSKDYIGELNILHSGVYNFGFLALKNVPICRSIIEWWGNRLQDNCFDDRTKDLYTDQKWGDYLSCFLGKEILVANNKGLNVAPWNFHERKIETTTNGFYVRNRIVDSEEQDKLVFVHYSGYNYKLLLSGEIFQKNIKNSHLDEDVIPLFQVYAEKLKKVDINSFIGEKYTYNYFDNSDWYIRSELRLLYRGFIENGNTLEQNPFDINGYIFQQSQKKGFLTNEKTTEYVFDQTNKSINRKTKYVNKLFSLLFYIVGVKRYSLFIRFMRKYSKIENHSFLIMSNFHSFSLK